MKFFSQLNPAHRGRAKFPRIVDLARITASSATAPAELKFASILICGLAAELRNSQPQSVLRFCVFGGQGFFGLTVTGRFVATHSHNPFCVFAETFDEYL